MSNKITSKKNYTIGIDVGGTKMRTILFDGEKVIADDSLATPNDTLEHFMVMLKALIEPLLEKAKKDKVKIKGIGLGIAGIIDYKERKMLHSPNISILDGVKIASELESIIERPVMIDNDAKCFIRAEALRGAARGYKSVYGVIIGTGIGGGWWYNGEVYGGAHGNTTELDTMIINLPSGLNLEEGYHKLTQNNPARLAQEALRADPLAERTFAEVGQHIGVALANIANVIDPEIFVLGGGVMASKELFLPVVKKTLKIYIASSVAAKKIKVITGKLGKNAGAIGAALLVA